MKKVIAIVGPTSTGKSDIAVDTALYLKKHGILSQIISADSRQIYRELNLLSGKITESEMKEIPHHMLDVASVRRTFTAEQYKKKTQRIINSLHRKGIIPILVGGTGFYIDSVLFDLKFPKVKPNKTLRTPLSSKSPEELFTILQFKDPERAEALGPHNRPRLIRAIEIAEALGSVPKIETKESPYDVLWIGLDLSDETLKKKIEKRIVTRMKDGMIHEAKQIHDSGTSWKRLSSLGLECSFASDLLQNKITTHDFITGLSQATWKYVKRQRTWFKRNKKIRWFNPKEKTIHAEVANFIKK